MCLSLNPHGFTLTFPSLACSRIVVILGNWYWGVGTMHNGGVSALVLSFLKWPTVVLVLVGLALFMFKTELKRLIDRTQRIQVPGGELQTAGPQSSADSVKNVEEAREELRKFLDNQLLVEREELISADLDKRNVSARDREKFLARSVALLSVGWQFESVYNTIWGSQLSLLDHLNSLGPVGMPLDQVRTGYFNIAAQLHPELYSAYTFEQWAGFLEGQQLVLLTKGRVAITLWGREFLKYLVDRGYRMWKAG